ncbi:Rha family transcriptional regulator [Aeromonas sp. MdU4]|uniref:Rha family transcriptional regulator n=1 Tax=Aeromonas sp. MdU4 TaxID=3342819 RepID=UPI0035B96E9C
MTNLTTVTNSSLTMSSIEIAELVGKRHDNVMRDIRAMSLELHGAGCDLRFEETHQNKQNGQWELRSLMKGGNRHNLPFQQYLEQGYFEVIEKPYDAHSETRLAFSPTITGKGQQWLAHKLIATGHLSVGFGS